MTGHPVPPPAHFTVPSIARVQDYLADGLDNYLIDRELGQRLLTVAPWLPVSVRANRAHHQRVLNCFTRELGIDQVIDLGCGLPHDGNRTLPDAVRSIVYVDSDWGVEAHARMILAERPGAASLLGDVADMSVLLTAAPISRLDRGRPIGVLLHDVLPWVDDDTAHTAVASLHEWLPPGSVLSLTHATDDFDRQGQMARLSEIYETGGITFRPRTREVIEAWLGAWTQLGHGGLVSTATWQPPSGAAARPPLMHAPLDRSHAYAVLAMTGDRTT
ncbi:SAM-dependent methyltransferase [Streptomyces alfalfae]